MITWRWRDSCRTSWCSSRCRCAPAGACWQCAASWGTWGRRWAIGRRRTGPVRRGRSRRCPGWPPRPGRPVGLERIRRWAGRGCRCRPAGCSPSSNRKRIRATRRRTSSRAIRSNRQSIGWTNWSAGKFWKKKLTNQSQIRHGRNEMIRHSVLIVEGV